MNKYIYLITVIFAGLIISCDDEVKFPYQGKDCVYFEHQYQIYGGYKTVTYDSVVFSFGKIDDEIMQDTAKIPIKLLGRTSSFERKYKVNVIKEGEYTDDITDAEEGKDYLKIAEDQIFRADSINDTLRVVLNREFLNKSAIAQESKTIILQLQPSEDFDLGINKGIEMRLIFNDFLSEPKWWDTHKRYFNYYHPEKWKILMKWDDKFKDANAPTLGMGGNEMGMYASSLRKYLDDNEVFDKETGERILMDRKIK